MGTIVNSKICSGCNELKTFSSFAVNKSSSDGYHSKCKVCKKAYHKEWYNRNKAAKSAKNKEYKVLNADKYSAQQKEYYRNTKEQRKAYHQDWYSKNKDRVLAQQKSYYEANKDKVFAKTIARSRHQYAMYSRLSKAYKAEIDGMYQFTSIFSGFEVDHIVPIKGEKVSGLHTPSNLQVLSREENRRKRNNFSVAELDLEADRLMCLNKCTVDKF